MGGRVKGYVQVYTGEGKCKTTAALGLVVRAVGAGLRVYLGQFVKGGDYSEILLLRARFPEVTVEQYGDGDFVRGQPSPAAIASARHGLAALNSALLSGLYDIIIADEAPVAVKAGLITEELVLTGRDASPALQARADLVTEMRCIKHYYNAGVQGRKGIES
jgi:cob(I)alamin adenosyltransferase